MKRASGRRRPGAPRRAALGCLVLGLAGVAVAEDVVPLKEAPGRPLAASLCNVCHSLEYIPSNAPAMNRAGWQKTLQKMRDRFGAPITDEEAKQILDYLDGNYSGKSS